MVQLQEDTVKYHGQMVAGLVILRRIPNSYLRGDKASVMFDINALQQVSRNGVVNGNIAAIISTWNMVVSGQETPQDDATLHYLFWQAVRGFGALSDQWAHYKRVSADKMDP